MRVWGLCSSATLRMCFAGALRPLYTLPRSEEACFVLNLPAILNLIYRRMLTTISDEHSIARTLCNALIIFSTYSFNSMTPFRTQSQLATSVKRISVPRTCKSRDSRARAVDARSMFLNYGYN